MNVFRYVVLATLLLCMFNAAVCFYVPGIVVLALCSAAVLCFRQKWGPKVLLDVGLICVAITGLLWTATRVSMLFFAGVAGIFLISAVVLFFTGKRWIEIVLQSLLMAGVAWCLFFSSMPRLLFHAFKEQRIAFLEHGNWGIAQRHDGSLSIRGQYFYDFLKRIIYSEDADDLNGIEDFSELWLMTPTKPFRTEEIQKIRNWVAKGGKLVVITDHTDLFGHSSALNPLLQTFGVESQKNCILDRTGDGGTYYDGLSSFRGLTANSFTGNGEAWLFQTGFSERADYSKNSFFSDNQISDEEEAGIHAVGLTSGFGLGTVVLFGDSTLFANFALSRPSSQALLQKVLNGGRPFPFYALATICLFIFIGFSQEGKGRLVAFLSAAFLGSWIVCLWGIPSKKLCYDFTTALEVQGDWSMVEDNGAPYATLFAASFSKSEYFPVWKGSSTQTEMIQFSNGIRLENEKGKVWKPCMSLDKRFQQPPSMSVEMFLETLIRDSWVSSFWFEEGVGPLKDMAYGCFWKRIAGEKENVQPFIFSSPEFVDCFFISSQKKRISVRIRIVRIKGQKPWIVVGDWIIGKEVEPGVILIRKNWQHPSWREGDIVLKFNS